MDYAQMARDILKNVGGEKNVRSLAHCTTRLRFKLKDKSEVDKSAINSLPGVIQIMDIAGQFQIVIGMEVTDIYREILKMTDLKREKKEKSSVPNENLFNQFIDLISGIFTPILGVLAGTGILKGFLILAVAMGMLSESDGTYQVLYAASDSMFYFLPVFLAITSAKKFDTDIYVAVVIACALLYPDLVETYQKGMDLSFFRIPVFLTSYATSVIPIILAVYVLSKLQPILNKWYPAAIKTFFTPLTLLAIMVPLTLLVFGPFGTFISEWLGQGYKFVYEGNEWIAGALVGFFWQILVIFGLHWGLVPIALNNLSKLGSDAISAMVTPAIIAQAGAALGIWLKTKQKKVKAIAAPATFAGLVGVTEPAIYGITLPYKKPFIFGCVSGAVGGAITGIAGTTAKAVAFPGVAALPVFLGEGFGLFLIAIFISFVLAAMLSFFFGINEEKESQVIRQISEKEEKAVHEDSSIIYSPLAGAVINLEDVDDAVFSSGAVGKGLAIIPVEGKLYAPFSGTVTMLFPSNHTIGLTSDAGIQMLIHLGIDTVQLEGKYFDMSIQEGDRIKLGQLLGTFNMEGITKEGFSVTSPVVVTNSDDYLDVIEAEMENTNAGDRLISVIK